MLSVQNRAITLAHCSGNNSVTFFLPKVTQVPWLSAQRFCLPFSEPPAQYACVEPKSVGGGSIHVWNAGAQQRSNKDEKIKCITVGFLAGNHVCDRVFGAS
jgi:hypothetical protein